MADAHGSIIGIYLAPSPGAPLQPHDSAMAVPGVGLEGDRFFQRARSMADAGKPVPPKMNLSMIESEALEALERDIGIALEPGAARRNLVTRGVALNHLVGLDFAIGSVRVRGIKLCEPCDHLEGLTQQGVRAGLIHRGGLRCQILSKGLIHLGDPVLIDQTCLAPATA